MNAKRSWALTHYLPHRVEVEELYPERRKVECAIEEANYLSVFDQDTYQNIARINYHFNNDYEHRFIPGDITCIYDTYTGIWKVWECPPAPEGNWCCTVDLDDASTESETISGHSDVQPCVYTYKDA